jgi:hypothetical protein
MFFSLSGNGSKDELSAADAFCDFTAQAGRPDDFDIGTVFQYLHHQLARIGVAMRSVVSSRIRP